MTVHVFALLFIDAITCMISCAISFSIDLALILDYIKYGQAYCNVAFLAFFYPSYFGIFLTLLIAAVRYFLAKKVFKNNRPSNFKVTCWCLCLFGLLVVVNVVLISINLVLDLPIGKIAEDCVIQHQGGIPRKVPLINLILFIGITFCPVISITIDLLLLAYIKRTITPDTPMITVTEKLGQGLQFIYI